MIRCILIIAITFCFAGPAAGNVVAPIFKQRPAPPVIIVTPAPAVTPSDSKTPVREVAKWTARWLEKPTYTWIDTFINGHGKFYEGGACPSLNQCIDGKHGVFGGDGRILIKAAYERLGYFYEKGFVMFVDKKAGFSTWEGTVLIQPKYIALSQLDNGFFQAELTGEEGFIILTADGREILRNVDDTVIMGENLFWASRHEKWGAYDRNGKNLLPHRFSEVTWVGDKASAVRVGKRWALVDEAGRQITPLKYSAFDYATAGVMIFNIGGQCEGGISDCEGGKFGVIREDGRIVVPAGHDCAELYEFGEDDVEIRTVDHPPGTHLDLGNRCHGGKLTHYKKDGKPVFGETFSYVDPLEDKKIVRAVKQGVCDTTGNCESGKWGLIDREGKIVLKYNHDWIAVPGEKATAFVDDRKWGLLDASYAAVVKAQFEMIHVDKDAVRFQSNGKWGVMDFAGQVLLPAKNDMILPFANGSARFLYGGRWGLVSAAGKVLVPATLAAICLQKMKTYTFASAGKCRVRWGKDASDPVTTIAGVSTRLIGTRGSECECESGTFGLMNAEGKTLLPARYQAIHVQSSMLISEKTTPGGGLSATAVAMPKGQVWLRLNQGAKCSTLYQCSGGKWGLADLTGRVVIPMIYAFIEPQIDYLVRVAKGASCDSSYWRANKCSADTKWGLMKLEPVK